MDGGTSGNYYIDTVSMSGTVTTLVSSGLNNPQGLVLGSGNTLYEADEGTGDILKITAGGAVSIFATGISNIYDLTIDSSGNLYADASGGAKIYKINTSGVVTTLATGLNNTFGLTIDSSGNLYSDGYGPYIDKISPAGVVTSNNNGVAYADEIALDASNNLYVAEGNSSFDDIKKITPGNSVSTFASSLNIPQDIVYDVIPEPSSLSLVLSALLFFGIVFLRRSRSEW